MDPETSMTVPQIDEPTPLEPLPLPVLDEIRDTEVAGDFLGQTKWWNDRLGYGFITVCRGSEKGKDIFVHHTGIKPLSSHYRTLYKGEYVQFDIQSSTNVASNNVQAVNVTGVDGGCLMCDVMPLRRYGGRRFHSPPLPLGVPPPPPPSYAY